MARMLGVDVQVGRVVITIVDMGDALPGELDVTSMVRDRKDQIREALGRSDCPPQSVATRPDTAEQLPSSTEPPVPGADRGSQ